MSSSLERRTAPCYDTQCIVPLFDASSGDLGVRFSKFSFLTDAGDEDTATNDQVLPLEPEDYPIGGSFGDMLRFESNAISPMVREDADLQGIDENELIRAVGSTPTYPNEDPENVFWQELDHVIQAQVWRRNEMTEMLPTLPDLWDGFSMAEYAEAVHDEYPGYWQSLLLASFFSTMKIDYDVLPERSHFDFVGGPIRMAVSGSSCRLQWK